MIENMIEKMKNLVRRKDICVLATVAENKPHCSLMAYVTDNDCREIYMVTGRATTKFKNLSGNPLVSLLIDTREEHAGNRRPEAQALTVSGIFESIGDENRKRDIGQKLLERHPHLSSFLENDGAEIICVKVLSFLLLDGLTEAHFEEI
jgi:nitroimidazol reductase NimA-like FMN-containing flavoprotein (pyridoxamine 5'-phosphate oxidase superfamily)